MKKILLFLFVASLLVLAGCGAAAPANKVQPIDLSADGSAVRFTASSVNDGGVKQVFVKRSDVDSKPTMLVSIDGAESFKVSYFPYTLATGVIAKDVDTVSYDTSLWEVKAE